MRILIAVLTIAFVLLLISVALLNHQEMVRLNLGEASGELPPGARGSALGVYGPSCER